MWRPVAFCDRPSLGLDPAVSSSCRNLPFGTLRAAPVVVKAARNPSCRGVPRRPSCGPAVERTWRLSTRTTAAMRVRRCSITRPNTSAGIDRWRIRSAHPSPSRDRNGSNSRPVRLLAAGLFSRVSFEFDSSVMPASLCRFSRANEEGRHCLSFTHSYVLMIIHFFLYIVPPSVTRHRPGRPSIRSSGGSQASLTPSSASNLSDTSSWSSWSHRARQLFPCCIDRHKERGPVATFLIKLLCCPYEPPSKLLEYMRIVISSWGYGIPFLFFTVLLLFGEPVQYLWFPKQADVAFNYLYTFAFAFFVIDIAMRCYVSPQYFVFEVFGLDYRHDAQGRRKPRPPTGGIRSGWGGTFIKIGSFMFWCDVLSTLTLLYDISWINVGLEERTELTVPVNAAGVAVSFFFCPIILWGTT